MNIVNSELVKEYLVNKVYSGLIREEYLVNTVDLLRRSIW